MAGRRIFALVGLMVLAFGPSPTSAFADAAGSPGAGAFVELGGDHACAVQADGLTRCWGQGSSGRLGLRSLEDRLAAPGSEASIVPVGSAIAVDAGAAHTCALLASGDVSCWGQGGAGQLGTGRRDNRLDGKVGEGGTDEASHVLLGSAAVSIAAGGFFSCAVVTGGTVRCWGQGTFGALGSRGVDNRLDGLGAADDATAVPLGGPAIAVTAGARHACALMATGAVRCWGSGGEGRLGSGASDDRLDGVDGPSGTDEASVVPLGAPAKAITAGDAHTCALLDTGEVLCWGAGGRGQLGSGSTDDRLDAPGDVPARVALKAGGAPQGGGADAPSERVVAIAAGGSHTCAVVADGDVRCWGGGAEGQLGQGATDSRLGAGSSLLSDAATRVARGPLADGPGLSAPAIAVTAASDSTCALLATGIVRCWGSGANGQLGSGARDARLDGTLDAVTRTDAASTVSIGRVALTAPQALQAEVVAGSLAAPPVVSAGPSEPTQVAPVVDGGSGTPAAVDSRPGVGAAPPSGAAAPLSFRFSIRGRSAVVAALLRPIEAGRCPGEARALVLGGTLALGKATLKVRPKAAFCRAAATFKLSRKQKRGAAPILVIRARGLATRRLALSR